MAKKAIFKMAAVAILNFKNCNFWSRDRNRVQYLMLCTKLHWNWKIFHWDNGDITIFKMVAIRHLGFWKFAVFVIWPLSACRSAFSHKISPKSNNRSRSYGQKKPIFKMAVAWLQSGSTFAVVYRIPSTSDNFSLRYGDLTIQNFAEIGQSVDE